MSTRIRTARLGALAGAALLALSACGSSTEDESAVEQPPAASDGVGTTTPEDDAEDTDEADEEDSEGTDDAAEDSDADEDTSAEDDEGVDAPLPADERMLSLFVREAPVAGDAEQPVIDAEDLADLLASTYMADGGAAEAECGEGLFYTAGDMATCSLTVEGRESMAWVAHPVWGPSEGADASLAVLFLHGSSPTKDALEAIGPNHRTVVGGKGTMYGADAPIPADQLGPDALDTLEITGYPASFSAITCEDDLDMQRFDPVACSAEKSEGGTVTVQVLPAPQQNDDPGLMVSVPVDQVQAG